MNENEATDPGSARKAEDALFERIAELAVEADHDQLVKLADAFAQVDYGPQGGSMDYDYSSRVDYHYTTHAGETRDRPAGFQ